MTADARRVSRLSRHGTTPDAVGAREIVFASQVCLRLHARTARMELPQTPNTWLAVDERETLWLGPDEWLVVSEREAAESVVVELDEASAGDHHAVVDVSADRVVLELTRHDRHEVLAAGCGIDLHPRSWRKGMCAQTLIANVGVLLQERTGSTRLFVRPSYVGHLVTWLGRVAAG